MRMRQGSFAAIKVRKYGNGIFEGLAGKQVPESEHVVAMNPPVASVNTHDMPPWHAWFLGLDLEDRRQELPPLYASGSD